MSVSGRLVRSALHPTDDTSAAGGNATFTPVNPSSSLVNPWMPPLLGQESGELDVDVEVQYQLAYVHANATDGETMTETTVALINALTPVAAPTTITAASDDENDDATKFLRVWGKSESGDLISEDIAMNGATPVTGTAVFTALYRAELRSGHNQVAAAGLILLTDSEDADIGRIPAGYRTATSEFALAAADEEGSLPYFSNRRTEPAGRSWVMPYAAAGERLALPGTGNHFGVYCRQTVQPGIATAELDVVLDIDGEILT